MNYADIKTVDIQDGDGVRVSIYVSGCHFHCKGCHNEIAWDFNYGKKFEDSTIDYILDLMNHEYIAGLSILGGEPLELVNQQELARLVKKVKETYPNKTIWCYTGYDFDKDVLGKMYKKYSYTQEFLENIDIMVDGEFEEQNKLTDLKFRGSTNQRKIDVQASLKLGKTISLKFGDESRYEGKPKIMLFKEFEKDAEEKENEKLETVKLIATSNVLSIEPSIQIQEVREKIAAGTINNDNKNIL